MRCPHHGSRHTLSHPGSPAQSHTHSPHSSDTRGVLPWLHCSTRLLHSDVSQPSGAELITYPPNPQHHCLIWSPPPGVTRFPSPFSKPLACHLSPTSGSSVQPVTPPPVPPPPVPCRAFFLKCKSGIVTPYFSPAVASCALRQKPALSALAPKVPSLAAPSPPPHLSASCSSSPSGFLCPPHPHLWNFYPIPAFSARDLSSLPAVPLPALHSSTQQGS